MSKSKLIYTLTNVGLSGLLAAILITITACSSSSDSTADTNPNGQQSNPDFILKADAITFNQLNIYKGHIKEGSTNPPVLNVGNINSGELVTIDIEFEVDEGTTEYGLEALLIPESIYSQIEPGSTVEEIINSDIVSADANQVDEFINLGGVFVDKISAGSAHGYIYSKLPVIGKDTLYKVLVMPSLAFLAGGEAIVDEDIKNVKVYLSDVILNINRLDEVSIKIITTPLVTDDNAITQLETGAKFGRNGYSIEPVFQTTVDLDLTTFKDFEEIVFSVNWNQSLIRVFPLGMLSYDEAGNSIVSSEARFIVDKTSATSVKIPVVVFNTTAAESEMLKFSTSIRNVSSQTVNDGEFELIVKHNEGGTLVDTGVRQIFKIPMVRMDNRLEVISEEEIIDYAVLRAGSTNEACVIIAPGDFDVDTDLLNIDAQAEIIALPCMDENAIDYDRSLWRYNINTKQIVSKEKDINGDTYCITWADQNPAPGSFLANDFNLRKCIVDSVGNGNISQKFVFENNKIRNEAANIYLDIIFTQATTKEIILTQTNNPAEVSNFFRDTNGVDLDDNGRLFHVGKFYDRGWGDKDLARIELKYGGESYINYMPVVGAVAEGSAEVKLYLFGGENELMGIKFGAKRHLAKKISLLGDNSPKAKVENGTFIKMGITGLAVYERGEIKELEIKNSYDPVGFVGNELADMVGVEDYENNLLDYKLDHEIIQHRIYIAGFPIDLAAGAKIKANITMAVKSPGIGIEAVVSDEVSASGYLSGQLDLGILKPGVEGEIEMITQKLEWSTIAAFQSPNTTEFIFNMGSSLKAELKLLRGKLFATLEYPAACWCVPPFKMKTGKKEIYTSPYLFKDKWDVFSKNLASVPVGL